MNVFDYLTTELNFPRDEMGDDDLMGDNMPIDSNCGDSCKRAIDAAKQLFEFNGHIDDCPARFEFIGHIVTAFGPNCDELKTFFDANDDRYEIANIAVSIVKCYIYG